MAFLRMLAACPANSRMLPHSAAQATRGSSGMTNAAKHKLRRETEASSHMPG
jgi:hypothetical protein